MNDASEGGELYWQTRVRILGGFIPSARLRPGTYPGTTQMWPRWDSRESGKSLRA